MLQIILCCTRTNARFIVDFPEMDVFPPGLDDKAEIIAQDLFRTIQHKQFGSRDRNIILVHEWRVFR